VERCNVASQPRKRRDKTPRGRGTPAALGFRAHSGWAALVAVAGEARAPIVIDRRRIIIADPAIPGSKQPYHYVEGWPLAKAEAHLRRCTEKTAQMAQDAVRAAIEELKKRGYRPAGAGVLTASGRPLPSLEATLASHALIHTAEGELYRNALADACQHRRLRVTRVKERELLAQAESSLHIAANELVKRATELGRSIGPPWTQDEKYATLIGWMVLAAAPRAATSASKRRS